MQDDPSGQLREVYHTMVVLGFTTYMKWVYFLGAIPCPTRVYFTLARLGNNSAKYNARTFVKSKSEVSLQMNTLQFKNYSGSYREDTVGNN